MQGNAVVRVGAHGEHAGIAAAAGTVQADVQGMLHLPQQGGVHTATPWLVHNRRQKQRQQLHTCNTTSHATTPLPPASSLSSPGP